MKLLSMRKTLNAILEWVQFYACLSLLRVVLMMLLENQVLHFMQRLLDFYKNKIS